MVFAAAIFVAIFGYALWSFLAARRYRRTIRDPRRNETFETFRASLHGSGYNERAIYDAYSDISEMCRHPVRPDDTLIGTLCMDPDDIDQLIKKRSLMNGIRDIWTSKLATRLPVNSVEDYAIFLSELYKFPGQ